MGEPGYCSRLVTSYRGHDVGIKQVAHCYRLLGRLERPQLAGMFLFEDARHFL
jgi:hypothetical protein